MRTKGIIFISVFFFLSGFFYADKALANCCSLPPFEGNTQPRCSAVLNETSCINYKGQYYAGLTCNEMTNQCEAPKCSGGKLCLQVPFPGSKTIEETAKGDTAGLLGKYIVAVFQFLVWAAISLAIFMIMLAGFMWLISAGNQGMISKAKGYITNALYGLIIALTSFVILQTINPELVILKMPEINAPTVIAVHGDQCCYETTTFDVRNNIELMEGKTCQDAFGALGGTWEKCPDIKKCCLCRETNLRTDSARDICYTDIPDEAACAQKNASRGMDRKSCFFKDTPAECLKRKICFTPGVWTESTYIPGNL